MFLWFIGAALVLCVATGVVMFLMGPRDKGNPFLGDESADPLEKADDDE